MRREIPYPRQERTQDQDPTPRSGQTETCENITFHNLRWPGLATMKDGSQLYLSTIVSMDTGGLRESLWTINVVKVTIVCKIY